MSSLPGQIGDDSLPDYGSRKSRGSWLVQFAVLLMLTTGLVSGADHLRPDLRIGERISTEASVLYWRIADGVRMMRLRAGI